MQNHDVRVQINKLRSINIEVPFDQELREYTTTLNSWKAESRCTGSFLAIFDNVKVLLRLAEDIILFVEDKILPVQEVEPLNLFE